MKLPGFAWLGRGGLGARPLTLALSLLSVGSSACATTGHLGDYDFRERTVAVATVAPPHPEVFTHGDWWLGDKSVVEVIVRVAADIAKQAEADRARVRLDSAVASVNVPERMSGRVLDQSARQMRSRPVASAQGADFEIELRVRRYGIEAKSWDDQVRFVIDADVLLLEGASGRLIWKEHVDERTPVSSGVLRWAVPDEWGSAVTAAQLASLSVADMTRALESLADYCADRMVDKLSRGLERVRD